MQVHGRIHVSLPGLGMAYRQGTTWYVSRFDDCPRIDDDTIVITKLHSSQLCREIIVIIIQLHVVLAFAACITR